MKTRDLAELSYHLVCLRSLGYRNARESGLAPREYELLLAIKTLPPGTRRGIRECRPGCTCNVTASWSSPPACSVAACCGVTTISRMAARLAWSLLPRALAFCGNW